MAGGFFRKKDSLEENQESDQYQDGYEKGADAAEEDLDDGKPDGWKTRNELSKEFSEDNSPVDFVKPEPIIPQIITTKPNPYEIGAEIVLTPSEANAGEKEYFDGRDDYVGGYQDGYGTTVEVEAEKHDPKFGEPSQEEASDLGKLANEKTEDDLGTLAVKPSPENEASQQNDFSGFNPVAQDVISSVLHEEPEQQNDLVPKGLDNLEDEKTDYQTLIGNMPTGRIQEAARQAEELASQGLIIDPDDSPNFVDPALEHERNLATGKDDNYTILYEHPEVGNDE